MRSRGRDRQAGTRKGQSRRGRRRNPSPRCFQVYRSHCQSASNDMETRRPDRKPRSGSSSWNEERPKSKRAPSKSESAMLPSLPKSLSISVKRHGNSAARSEAAVGIVKLERGKAKVEEGAVEIRVRDASKFTEVTVNQRQTTWKLGGQRLPARSRPGVPVERHDPDVSRGLEDGPGMPPSPERAVQVLSAGTGCK